MNILNFPAALSLAFSLTAIRADADIPTTSTHPLSSNVCSGHALARSSDAVNSVDQNLTDVHRDADVHRLVQEANAANDSGDDARAAESSLQAFCSLDESPPNEQARIEIAALAIELLLEAKRTAEAISVFDMLSVNQRELERNENVPFLHLTMAMARLLSFEDLDAEALELRLKVHSQIVHVFGMPSREAIENRVRIDNLKLELGLIEEATSDLSNLRSEVAADASIRIQEKLLLIRAIASAYGLGGREVEAIEILRSARDEVSSLRGPDDARAIRLDQSIGEFLTRINPSEEALEVASRVYLWRLKHLQEGDIQSLRSLWQLAYLYSENARLEVSRSIIKVLLAVNHLPRQFELQILSLSAELDIKQGNNIDALAKAEAVYRGTRELLGDDSVDTQTAEANFALALRKVGDISKGCSLLQSIQRDMENIRPNDSWTLEFSRIELSRCFLEARSPEMIAKGLNLLAQSWSAISLSREATSRDALNVLGVYAFSLMQAGLREESVDKFERYVTLAERSRNEAAEGSIARLASFSSWIFQSAPDVSPIACYRELALLHAQDDELERALRISELARDRTLTDRFAEQAWFSGALPAAEQHRLEPLLDQIQALDERIAVTTDLMERVRLESERTIAVAQRGRLEREISRRVGVSEPEPVPPTLDALRARLDSDAALVSVVHSPDAWWALVIRRDAPARFVALPAVDLGRTAAAWVQRLRGEPVRAWPLPQGRLVIDDLRPQGAVGGFLNGDQLGARLSSELLAPLLPALGAARHLVFVGDDELVGVPLQALPLGNGLAVDTFDVTYAPSLTTYARWQGRRSTDHARDLLAVGAVEALAPAPPPGDDSVAMGLAYAADYPLPHARDEIDAIAALFPRERRRLMTGSQARKASLRRASQDGELAGYRYVHFATHAWADPEQPEASAVVLSGEGTRYPLQRVLTAAELAGLHMRADLIVLSGCDTGAGHFEHGRGLLGLAYAALAAGNRAAVISLWPIADDTTAPFMARFYARLRRGQGPAAAMAATQREFRASADPRRASPAAWAAFMVYGGY